MTVHKPCGDHKWACPVGHHQPPHSYLNLVEPPVEVPSPHLSRQYELYRHLGFIPTCRGYGIPTTPLRRRPPRRLASSDNKSTVPAPTQAPQAICLPNTGIDVQNDRRRSLPDPKTSGAARVPTHIHQELAIRLIPGMKEKKKTRPTNNRAIPYRSIHEISN